jgi:hypothetical protein
MTCPPEPEEYAEWPSPAGSAAEDEYRIWRGEGLTPRVVGSDPARPTQVGAISPSRPPPIP